MNQPPDNSDERTVVGGAPEDGSDKLPIGLRLGEFEITGLVGEGGFSIVYLAWDHSLDRKVALKEYMPSSLAARKSRSQVLARSERHRETFDIGLKSFINEGKLLAHFDHPALVKVYRFWEANGTAYMVMPYYEGLTLKDTVRAMSQPPNEAWLMGVLDPLTEALSVIHREQCFHRDIAPDNVMLLAPGSKPLLLDFGAARRLIGDKTQALTVILKPGYAPVEQYAEDSAMKQGPWTDVYALAAVIYWAITGKTPPVSVGRMLNDSYVPLAACAMGRYSATFLAAVDRALAVLPDQRTASIAHFRRDIGLGAKRADVGEETVVWSDPNATLLHTPLPPRSPAIEQHQTIEPVSTPPGARSAPHAAQTAPPRRTPIIAAVAGTVLAIGIGGMLWWTSRAVQPPPVATTTAPAPNSTAPTATTDAAWPLPGSEATSSQVHTPRTAQGAFDQLLAQRDPSIDVSASAKSGASGTSKSTLRLHYRSSQAGYIYVVALSPNANHLALLHPSGAAVARRAADTGSIDVSFAAVEAGTRLLLVVARERREPQSAGWYVRDRTLVRNYSAGAGADAGAAQIESLALGAPQCTPRASKCDGAFGVTEVTQVTNVTPQLTPSETDRKRDRERVQATPATPAPGTTAPRANSPATEGKTQAQGMPGNSAECARILQHISLGDSSPELIERMKTLGCR